jgi:UTP--glucose-1-phosphate uridylyltransferase
MSIEVAVIPAAGKGTRMRPATRVIPKALLTVVDRPAIQYAVEEAARAGAKEAVVVVDLDAGHLVAQHFSLEGPLPGLEDIRVRPVVQEEALGLGHAVSEAEGMVAGRPFFCLLSDRIVRPGHDVLLDLWKGSRDASVSVVYLRALERSLVSSYGVAIPTSEQVDGYLDVGGAVEKPSPEEAPSRLGLDGRYLFTPEVFDLLARTAPGVGGEVQLTDAINVLGSEGRLRGFVSELDLLDVGTPAGLVDATAVLGGHLFG